MLVITESITNLFQMYAYGFVHEPLLGNLCHLLEQIVHNPGDEPIKWQVCIFILTYVALVLHRVLDDIYNVNNAICKCPCSSDD